MFMEFITIMIFVISGKFQLAKRMAKNDDIIAYIEKIYVRKC